MLGRAGRGHRGVAEEVEIAGRRRAFPRRLHAVGRVVHLEADALEQLLDRQVRLARQMQEGLRVRAVAAVQCRRALRRPARSNSRRSSGSARRRWQGRGRRRRCSGNGLLRQESSMTMRSRLGIVSSVAIRSTRRSELLTRSDGRGDLGVDRDQIVLARDLHAVAGVIDHRHRVRSALGDLRRRSPARPGSCRSASGRSPRSPRSRPSSGTPPPIARHCRDWASGATFW